MREASSSFSNARCKASVDACRKLYRVRGSGVALNHRDNRIVRAESLSNFRTIFLDLREVIVENGSFTPMNRDSTLFTAFVVASLAGIAAPAMADPEVVTTHLVGYQETPATINSAGSGNFVAKISEDGTSIEYELSYSGLFSTVLQAHIHFGRPATSGGIALFLG